MHNIHPRLIVYLHFISKFLKKTYPRPMYTYDSDTYAKIHYAVFAFIMLSVILNPVYCIVLNINVLTHILMFRNNIFILGALAAYIRFTCTIAVLFFGLLYLMAFILYCIEDERFSSNTVLFILLDILTVVEIVIAVLWCIYMYYAYIYLIQIVFICYLDEQSIFVLNVWVVVLFFLLLLLRYIVSRYLPQSRLASLVCTLATLAFFNLLIAFILSPFLLCKNIEIFIWTFGREVHVCLICTSLYLFILVCDGKWPLKFYIFEFYILAGLTGWALGSRIFFKINRFIFNLFFYDIYFSISSSISYVLISILLLTYLYIFLRCIFNIFSSNPMALKILDTLFIILFIITIFFFIGIFVWIICFYASSNISILTCLYWKLYLYIIKKILK